MIYKSQMLIVTFDDLQEPNANRYIWWIDENPMLADAFES